MKLKINEPCHEDWSKMTSKEPKIGMYSRHCDSCEKSVVDFTQNSRAEIIAYMISNRENSICGRMRADQFDFKHEDIPVLLVTLDRQKTANPFLILALVCMSLSAYGQQETNTEIKTPPPIEHHVKMGKMVAMPVEPETPDTTEVSLIKIKKGEIRLGDISVETPEPIEEDKIFKFTQQMPEYLGGIGEMNVFIEDNKSYRTSIPAHGTVYVRFVVNPDGSVSHATIARGFYKELDKEALNIISRKPKWIPGEKDGKKVPVYMTVPVTY